MLKTADNLPLQNLFRWLVISILYFQQKKTVSLFFGPGRILNERKEIPSITYCTIKRLYGTVLFHSKFQDE